jgi:peptidyl-prolyl cis-trans isomerase B (cyclophilin B)
VSSVRDRQRAAARAKLEREMAARAEAARRKRLLQARIGAGVAGAVVIALVVWIVVAATGGKKPSVSASSTPSACEWIPEVAPGQTPPAGVKEVGMPPTNVPRSGYQVLTFTTNLGVIKVEMDLAKAPCTSANLAYLATKKFYDNTSCHRLVESIFALQCGDPSGTGSGGASYRFADENLPTDKLPAYHEGDVAMANRSTPVTDGSQFFFIWKNSPLPGKYSLFGRVIQGLDIVKKVAAGGDDGASGQKGDGHPKTKITFKSVTVGPVTQQSAATPATPPASPSGPASPSAAVSSPAQ